jgi:23S rRNA (uracil1939-C5)-methyltransferase
MSELAGDTVDIVIDGMGASGDGVGRLPDGRVVFVGRALPGDRVRVRPAAATKKVQFAELVEVLSPSADRIESRCKVAACGGCPLKGQALPAQGHWKVQRVLETLRRIGHLDVSETLHGIAQLGEGWRSRHRVRLHAAWSSGKRFKLGYYERHSRSLVALSACPILWSELEQAALNLATALEGLPETARLEEVELVYSRRDGRAAAKLRGGGPIERYKEWLADVAPKLPFGIEIETPGFSWRHGNLELRYDHRRSAEFDLRYEPGVFTQANPEMNDRLVEALLEQVRPAQAPRVLELHAGIGNFSVPLRLAGADVVAVERHRRAAVLCRKNARSAGVDLEVLDQPDSEAVHTLSGFDTVVLDPPRIGARSAAQALTKKASVRRVVYVSCDAATLARDAEILVHAGFRVAAARAFDMFPETPHVEVVLTLER